MSLSHKMFAQQSNKLRLLDFFLFPPKTFFCLSIYDQFLEQQRLREMAGVFRKSGVMMQRGTEIVETQITYSPKLFFSIKVAMSVCVHVCVSVPYFCWYFFQLTYYSLLQRLKVQLTDCKKIPYGKIWEEHWSQIQQFFSNFFVFATCC